MIVERPFLDETSIAPCLILDRLARRVFFFKLFSSQSLKAQVKGHAHPPHLCFPILEQMLPLEEDPDRISRPPKSSNRLLPSLFTPRLS